MNRYMLFAGETHYPNGGVNDLIGGFDTAEAAKARPLGKYTDWAHVADAADGLRVLWEWGNGGPFEWRAVRVEQPEGGVPSQ